MDVKKRIIDFHGRIENINLYNMDPYPIRTKKNDFRKQPKPRIPPFRGIAELVKLKKERDAIKEQEEKDAKKKADEELKKEHGIKVD